jgi:hypothetical protein
MRRSIPTRLVPLLTAMVLTALVMAAGPPDRIHAEDQEFEGLNPCTGALDTVRVFDIVLIVHTVLDAAGGRHHTAQFSASVSTAAGFEAKREIQTLTMQAASGPSDLEVHHATVSVAAQGPNGQVLVGRVVIHLGVRGGEPVLAFERFDFSCRGKPATSRFEGRLLQS